MNNAKPIGIVLMQFGGPDSLEAVEPFLRNLFSDPDIISLPFSKVLQRPLAKLISRRRSPSVKEKYAEIGGKSPIVEKTFEQKAALQAWLDEKNPGKYKVWLAMRYWKPDTASVVREMKAAGITEVVLLPLYAQYSKTNAGSSYNEWERQCRTAMYAPSESRIYFYHLDIEYLTAMNQRVDEALDKFGSMDGVEILFSAHGTPVDMVMNGDPYVIHINETVEALMEIRGRDFPHRLSFQSKVGPKQWIGPSTTETLKIIGSEGIKKLLVVPVAFVSDHIETLHELEIEERKTAMKAGIGQYVVMEGLNDAPKFIEFLGRMSVGAADKFGN